MCFSQMVCQAIPIPVAVARSSNGQGKEASSVMLGSWSVTMFECPSVVPVEFNGVERLPAGELDWSDIVLLLVNPKYSCLYDLSRRKVEARGVGFIKLDCKSECCLVIQIGLILMCR